MEITNRLPVSIVEAKEILSRKKEDEMGYEQKITLDYLRNYANLPKESVVKATEELSKMDFLKPHQIVTILNLMPKNKEELRVIFMKERITLEGSQEQSILDELDKIREFEKKPKKGRIIRKEAKNQEPTEDSKEE